MGTQTDYFKVPRKWKEFHVHRTASEKLRLYFYDERTDEVYYKSTDLTLMDLAHVLVKGHHDCDSEYCTPLKCIKMQTVIVTVYIA